MIVQFGQFKAEIDVDKTQEFYKKMECVSKGCDCAGCRNYESAIDFLPDEVTHFFYSIGIDMKKISEVYVNTTNPDGTVFYGGFYHLCGKLLEGKSAWVEQWIEKDTVRVDRWEHSKTYSVSKDFYISFQEDCSLVETGFPAPVLQLEIEANIPWVLKEKNTYL